MDWRLLLPWFSINKVIGFSENSARRLLRAFLWLASTRERQCANSALFGGRRRDSARAGYTRSAMIKKEHRGLCLPMSPD
jgi:hypothetical protein